MRGNGWGWQRTPRGVGLPSPVPQSLLPPARVLRRESPDCCTSVFDQAVMDLLQRQPKQDIGTMTVFAEVGLVASAASLRAGWGQLGCLHEAEGRRRGPSADTAASQQGSQWPWSLARSRPGALLAVPGSHSPARCVSAPGFHQLGALQRPGPGHPPVPPRERGLAAAQAGGQKPRHAVWKTREGGQGQPGPVRVCAWGWLQAWCAQRLAGALPGMLSGGNGGHCLHSRG